MQCFSYSKFLQSAYVYFKVLMNHHNFWHLIYHKHLGQFANFGAGSIKQLLSTIPTPTGYFKSIITFTTKFHHT